MRLKDILKVLIADSVGFFANPLNGVDPKKVLMVVLTHLGDAVRTLHLARTLNEAGYELYAVAKPIPAELLRLSGLFKEIHEYEPLWVSRKAGWRNTVKGALAFARWARKNRFSVCVVTHVHPFNYVLAKLSGAPRRVGHAGAGAYLLTDVVATAAHHGTIDAINALAAPLGMSVETRWPVRLAVSERTRLWAQERLGGEKPVLLVHPGAGGPYNRWAQRNFARVIRAVGRRTVVVHGPGERAIAERVAALSGNIPVVAPRNVEGLVALIQAADLFLGNDAGPSHIAVARGVPTIVTFMQEGKRDVWGYDLPHYTGVEVFRMGDEAAVETVAEACIRMTKETT